MLLVREYQEAALLWSKSKSERGSSSSGNPTAGGSTGCCINDMLRPIGLGKLSHPGLTRRHREKRGLN